MENDLTRFTQKTRQRTTKLYAREITLQKDEVYYANPDDLLQQWFIGQCARDHQVFPKGCHNLGLQRNCT